MNNDVTQLIEWSDWIPVRTINETRFPDQMLVKVKYNYGGVSIGNANRFNWGQSITNDASQVAAYQVITEIEQ